MKKVLCHGVFDVLHTGHLAYFQAAKKFGDYLVVSVTTDRHVNKGPGRPYFSSIQRAEMLRALGLVDKVVISDHPTAVAVIEEIKPDFYVKGPDYKDLTKDVTGEIYNEKTAVEKHGGQLVFTDEPTHSSSTLINRFFHNWTDTQRDAIERVRQAGGIEAIEKAVAEIAKLKVLVVGEPISDVYRFCMPEGISSKSPSISARFQYEEKYAGGADAIFNHLDNFACQELGIMWPLNREMTGINIPEKIRYISSDKQQRIFEVTNIDEKDWNHDFNANMLLQVARKADVVIAADFGHGLFEGPMLEAMSQIKCFMGLNVQTNSSNFGFNVHTKHTHFNYLCIDTREARLASHDRYSSPSDVARDIRKKLKSDVSLGVTFGSNGSALFYGYDVYKCPAFSKVVIDATGAGDAYFAITTVLLASACDPALIPFIGNVFAGLKTKIIGNKSSVSKASLLKACTGILK